MKRIITCALVAMLALTGCVPLEYASVPADQPTAATPAPIEAPAATAATATPTQAPATPAPTPKATEKPTPKPAATPKATPTASAVPSASPSPAPEAQPTALKPVRQEAFNTFRTMGRQPVALNPEQLARTLRCKEGENISVDGKTLLDALADAALPESLLPVSQEGDPVQVGYHRVEALPIGGQSREAAVFLLDHGQGWNVTVLLFLRDEGGWVLSDVIAAGKANGFQMSLPNYISSHSPKGLALSGDTFLLYSDLMQNAWLVHRSADHGTGYLTISERWYNLHTAETEISAALYLQESVGFSTAEFAQGVVMPHDLSMMQVYEQISHVTGDPWAGAKEDNTGVWTRRYTFNRATYRMELDWERYDEGISMAYAMAVIDGPKIEAPAGTGA